MPKFVFDELGKKNTRIEHIYKIIENMNNDNFFMSKKYYIKLLKKEICYLYSYNLEYVKCLFLLFPIREIAQFFIFSQKERPLSIRINSLKIEPASLKENLSTKGIKILLLRGQLCNIGMISGHNNKIGNCSEYLGGYFTFQGISSVFPVISISPEKNDKILDLTAAPGGKATYLAEIMKNSGLIVANDKSLSRIKSLVTNIHRMGIKNSIITSLDGSILPFVIKGFDRVLLDAPCSGSGVLYNNEMFRTFKFKKSLVLNSELQKRLLLAAIDSCDENSSKGGIIVYCTCSIFVEENEAVIQYALENRNIKIIPTDLNYGLPGYKKYKMYKFNEKMNLCRRFFSHVHNSDGFFVCKLKKLKKKFIT